MTRSTITYTRLFPNIVINAVTAHSATPDSAETMRLTAAGMNLKCEETSLLVCLWVSVVEQIEVTD
jgi:hypothetical protein